MSTRTFWIPVLSFALAFTGNYSQCYLMNEHLTCDASQVFAFYAHAKVPL